MQTQNNAHDLLRQLRIDRQKSRFLRRQTSAILAKWSQFPESVLYDGICTPNNMVMDVVYTGPCMNVVITHTYSISHR